MMDRDDESQHFLLKRKKVSSQQIKVVPRKHTRIAVQYIEWTIHHVKFMDIIPKN